MAEIDRSVIEGLRRGDARAFEVVIDELHRPVYRFILRMCGDVSVSEDLTQETFLAVWQSVGSFQGRSRFKTWVFGIAYRQFLRHRDKKVLQTVPLDDGRDEGGGEDPSAAACRTDEQHRVREAVYGLPDLYREAVCMVHLDGLSYREAAEALGIPAGTLKSRMSSAFQFLRKVLGGSFTENVNDGTPAECGQGEVQDEMR